MHATASTLRSALSNHAKSLIVAACLSQASLASFSIVAAVPASAATGDTTAVIASARQLMSGGNARQAVTTLSAYININPADLDARRCLAEALISSGYTVRAVAEMSAIIKAGKYGTDDLIILGDGYRYSADQANAAIAYSRALKLDPSSAKARSGLALTFMSQRKFDDAISLCRLGISQSTDFTTRQQLVKTLQTVIDNRRDTTNGEAAISIAHKA